MSRPATQEREVVSPAHARYEDDLYSWALEQARMLRENGDADGIDRLNIAEELEDVAKREASKLRSSLAVLLMHMLKWDYQPERATRSWDNSIAEHRRRYQDLLADNPGLKGQLSTILLSAYRDACSRASTDTDIPRDEFPETCPYSTDDILHRPFEFNGPVR